MNVVILIIAHKHLISEQEQCSLRQCFNILGNFRIVLICPEGLNTDCYKRVVPEAEFQFIDPKWQSTYAMFNKLKISPMLYEMYSSYKYILFFELDVWIFRDELEFWCDQGFDYIGAPWINIDIYKWLFIDKLYPWELKTFHRVTGGMYLKRVGNGGLSLRKTEAMISNLNLFSSRIKLWRANEDSFFSHYLGTFNVFFKIPPVEVALRFAFDVHPEVAYHMNHEHLPFGCHGFNRSDSPNYTSNLAFWKQHIAELNQVREL